MRIETDIGSIVAALLWQHGAIRVDESKPFLLFSGNFTPLYVNCRLLLSYPSSRDIIISFARRLFHEKALTADCIAGGETAGIALGAWLAEKLDKPFVYVRKKKKDHGTGSRVEGEAKGEVLLFEDLITDGGSKISFIEGIRESGCSVSNCLTIVDREQGGTESLARVGVKLHSLVSIFTCLQTGLELELISSTAVEQVKQYLADPVLWHKRSGLQFNDEID